MRIPFVYAALTLLLFSVTIEASEDERLKCIDKLRLAFELQSRAKTYKDSYNNCVLFNSAQDQLEKMGEPKNRLDAIRGYWLWYRMYGYSCKLLQNPVQSPDEYTPRKRLLRQNDLNHPLDTKFDYKQERYMRDFLAGVGAVISGVFCVAVSPPIGGRFGVTLIASGGLLMWHAMNNLVVDSHEKEARLAELERLQKQAEATAKQ